ncbi:ATP-binding protein [Spirillospora sp. NPDC029432]|uniref:ATP-binding protein n=1 Tax=Spirillospora sp. NPDC029432 TaxID=3154599 RepID=UPI003453561D
MGEATHHEIVIKRQLEAVAEVRRFIRLTLGRWGMEDYNPCLVASELVTNAIRYASTDDDEVTVRLGLLGDGALWLEVQDSSSEIPRIVDVALTSGSGRGLFVVEQFTRYWGVRPLDDRGGKVVFAVLNP